MDFLFTKQGLIDALEARRPWAESLDKKQSAEHKTAEKKALLDFRVKLKAALKWDYATCKARTRWRDPLEFEAPTCPQSMVSALETALGQVRRDGRSRYRISSTGPMRNVHFVLTHHENAKPDVCK